jgi:glutathione S-transferase
MSGTLRLYNYVLSGHGHRVELLLSMLGLPYNRVEVDLRAGEQRTPEFRALNPFGQVPVLVDGALVISDSNAILVYLAQRYDPGGSWFPVEPPAMAEVQRWLSVAAGPLVQGPAIARRNTIFATGLDSTAAITASHRLLAILETFMGQRQFLAGDVPTLADLANYTYIAHAPEGGVSLDAYPHVRVWLGRVEALAGFVALQRA